MSTKKQDKVKNSFFLTSHKSKDYRRGLRRSFCSIELIKNCKLLLSTDTSFVHVASAFQKEGIFLYRNLGSSKNGLQII